MSDHGIHSRLKFTEEGDMIRHDVQDIGDILDANKREKLSGENDQKGREGRKFAAVPLIVLEALKQHMNIDYNLVGVDPDHTGRFFLWLQENPAFRTSEATLRHGSQYVR